MRDQGNRHRGDEPDRRKVLARVVAGIGVEARIDRNRAGVAEQQRVAVGLGLGDRAGAKIAAGAGAVVHHDGVLKRDGKFFRDDPRQRIDAAARRKRHHQRDGADGICLRSRGGVAKGGCREQERNERDDLFHAGTRSWRGSLGGSKVDGIRGLPVKTAGRACSRMTQGAATTRRAGGWNGRDP